MKTHLLVLAAFAAVSASAVSVSDVTVSQNLPWDARVRISYTLDDEGAGGVYDVSSVRIVRGGLSRTIENGFPACLSGDLTGVPAGRRTIVWDPAKSTNLFNTVTLKDVKVAIDVAETAAPKNYLVIDLSAGPDAASWPSEELAEPPAGGWTEAHKTTKLVLRRIRPGTATIGRPADEPTAANWSWEQLREVTFTNAFWIGVFELTQKQFELITGIAPSEIATATYADGDAYPLRNVGAGYIRGMALGTNWPAHASYDADSLLGILQAKVVRPASVPVAWQFDLPTSEQWEYACRAGTSTPWNNDRPLNVYTNGSYEADDNLNRVGWFKQGVWDGVFVPGQKEPNRWGLYDMHGNVSEMCLDLCTGAYSGIEPKGTAKSAAWKGAYCYRAIRGGNNCARRSGSGVSEYTLSMLRAGAVDRCDSAFSVTSCYYWLGYRLALAYVHGNND